eukprot:4812291-Pyramimonas_sp.AAC.1
MEQSHSAKNKSLKLCTRPLFRRSISWPWKQQCCAALARLRTLQMPGLAGNRGGANQHLEFSTHAMRLLQQDERAAFHAHLKT